jgi:hypothetical protein
MNTFPLRLGRFTTLVILMIWCLAGMGRAQTEDRDLPPLPADLTSDIDAILDAATAEEAIFATRRVLDRAGVAAGWISNALGYPGTMGARQARSSRCDSSADCRSKRRQM